MLDIPSYFVKRLQRAGYKGIDSLIKSSYMEIAARTGFSDYERRQLQTALRNWRGGELPLQVSDDIMSAIGMNRRIHAWLAPGELKGYLGSQEATAINIARKLARMVQDEHLPTHGSSFWVFVLRLVRGALAEKKRAGVPLVILDSEAKNLIKYLATFSHLDDAVRSVLVNTLLWGSSNHKPVRVELPKSIIWNQAATAVSADNKHVTFAKLSNTLFLAAPDAMDFEVAQIDFNLEEPVAWSDREHESNGEALESAEEGASDIIPNGRSGQAITLCPGASLPASDIQDSKANVTGIPDSWKVVSSSYEYLFSEYEVTQEEFAAIISDTERFSIEGAVEKVFAFLDSQYAHASKYRRIPLRSGLNDKQLNESLRKRMKAYISDRAAVESVATTSKVGEKQKLVDPPERKHDGASISIGSRDANISGSVENSSNREDIIQKRVPESLQPVALGCVAGVEMVNSRERVSCTVEKITTSLPDMDADLSIAGEGGSQAGETPSADYKDGPLTLHQWLDSMGAQSREFLVGLFSGESLRESAKNLGIRVSQAREMRKSLLEKKPPLNLDRLKYLYEQYALDDDAIASIITEDALSQGYLRFSFKPGRWPLHTSERDREIDEPLKESIKRYLHKDLPDFRDFSLSAEQIRETDSMVCNQSPVDGDDEEREQDELDEARLVELAAKGGLTSEYLIRFILNKQAGAHPITIEQFSAAYHAECLKLSLDQSTMRLPMNTLGAIANSGRALVVSRDHIRYYDFDSHDFMPLIGAMRAERERNMECSASLPFGWHRNLMDELDIQTPEELHAVLRLIRAKQPIEDVELDVTPLIKFGSADRRDQIIMTMEDLGEASTDKLAEEYEERYGVPRDLFCSDQFEGLVQAYCTDGLYSYRATGLSHTQREELRRCLEGADYISCSLVQSRMKSSFPSLDWASVQDALLSVGYRESGALLVRSDVDERDLFNALIEQNESLKKDAPGFGKDVFNNSIFRSILESKKRAFDIVEVSDSLYISIHKLEAFGIHKWNCEFYVNAVIARTPDEEPFTIHSLRRNGFEHPMDSLRDKAGLDDFFYTSLVSVSAPKRGVRKTTCGGSTVFCKTRRTFNMTEFIRAIVNRHGVIYINELVDLLEDEYGVLQTDSRLIRIVEEDAEGADGVSHMFYDSSLGLVAASPKAAAAEKERLILGGKHAR